MNFMFEWQEQYLTSERSEREYPLAIYYMAVSHKDWERTFRFSGTALFNSLPCKIQQAVSLSSFKNLVKAHFYL